MPEVRAHTTEQLMLELEELRIQLNEANDTIEAIRTGQVDALVLDDGNGHQLYTLKSADQAYRVFIEKMTEGAVTLNKEGVILYCNSQFASMVSQPLSNVIGQPFQEFVDESDKEIYRKLFQKGWKKDQKVELCMKAGAGTLPVQLSLTPLPLEEGKALSIILTDLSMVKKTQLLLEDNNRELEAMNHALEASNHDLQQFASVASHDLQEPLRKIQIFSNLLRDRMSKKLTSESRNYLEKIIESAGRMRTLIIDVLNYSKLSARHKVFESLDLNTVVNDLLEDFDLIIHEKKAVVTILGNLPTIVANRGQIRQVFQNIISNALKFCRKDTPPVIQINAKRLKSKSFESPEDLNGSYCLIDIKDNGIGFEEKYLSNIFALFERLHSKDVYEGTGIGLAITKKIIEKHKGLITAKSRLGEGAEFLLLLPVEQE